MAINAQANAFILDAPFQRSNVFSIIIALIARPTMQQLAMNDTLLKSIGISKCV